ncbi:hypothetical protein M501DRAFT_1055063 [Patellaria atrata CBS 101060]|uniref:DUF6604 domain-containing protein n=1 Tax=Patellaria atrata CBS 101060 TaxID=1346257 RepID=A0A9P4SHF1_9PEZI|nr:hypothetical protein M501DRAFT_1055063 [Patellaria atrata CBS 101060]
MDTELIRGDYKQYKSDTEFVAWWLATTAKEYGFKSENASLDPCWRSNVKLNSYLIAIRDFIPLAQYIKGHYETNIPSAFRNALDRAIRLRKRFHVWFRNRPRKDNKSTEGASDKSHRHFVEVLERVRDILLYQPPQERVQGYSTLSEEIVQNGMGNLPANIFDLLTLEEPTEESARTKKAATIQSSKSTVSIEYSFEEVQDDEDEMTLALFLLFSETDCIRSAICGTWSRYHKGEIDVIAASLATETGIWAVRDMEQQFPELYPRFDDIESLILGICNVQCEKTGAAPVVTDVGIEETSPVIYEIKEKSFYLPWRVLSLSFQSAEYSTLLQMGSYFLCEYDSSKDLETLSMVEKQEEDIRILDGILRVLYTAYSMCLDDPKNPPLTAEDALVRLFRDAYGTGKTTLAVVFAMQVYLDIHHEMRNDVSKGYVDLRKTANAVKTTINQTANLHATLGARVWITRENEMFSYLITLIETVAGAELPSEIPTGLEHEPLSWLLEVLTNHPWQCGLIRYCLQMNVQEVGLRIASTWGSIIFSAHLYNAVRQEQILEERWKDMDTLMVIHGQNAFFPGGVPKTPPDYVKRCGLKMGVSLANWAPNRRDNGLTITQSQLKGLEQVSPVSRIFKERYCEGKHCPNLSEKEIETVLSKGSTNAVLSCWRNKEMVDEHTVLNSLCDAIQTELFEIYFDYLSMHRTCMVMLRQVRTSFYSNGNQSGISTGAGSRVDDREFAIVVYEILRTGSLQNGVGTCIQEIKA